MDRVLNPYNVVAFYPSRTEASKQCRLYAPPTGINWQFPLAGGFSSHSVNLVSAENDLDVFEISTNPAILAKSCPSAGGAYLTYNGGGMTGTPPEGHYFYRVQLDSTYYFSQEICIENPFKTQTWGASASCTSAVVNGVDFTIDFGFDETLDFETSVEVDFQQGAGFEYRGSVSGSIDQDDFTTSGTKAVLWRMKVCYNEFCYYKTYRMSFDTSTPCAYSFGLYESGGNMLDAFSYLEFYNSSDLQGVGASEGLLYQGGYKQRFYFKPKRVFPTPTNEFSFIENGESDLIFQSAALAERVVFDAHPVPDYLLQVLSSIQAHDSVFIKSPVDSFSIVPEDLNIAPRTDPGDLCSIVQFSYERNRGFVNTCGDNIPLTAC